MAKSCICLAENLQERDMRSKVELVAASLVFSLVAAVHPVLATGQDAQPASLEEQLKAQFTTIKACGGSATNGTVLVVQKEVVAVGAHAFLIPKSKYQDGKLQPPSKLIFGPSTSQPLTSGAKVYPTQVGVDLGKDTVGVAILACDPALRASVEFKFAKGTLQGMSVPQVMDTISQVLAFNQPADANAQADPPQQPQDQQHAGGQDPPAQPPTIQPGQTVDEVIAAYGKPDRQAVNGSKLIFMYGGLKVTFTDGKVTDVE
jgi:hypothetical protein